jgi:hypothetical protein
LALCARAQRILGEVVPVVHAASSAACVALAFPTTRVEQGRLMAWWGWLFVLALYVIVVTASILGDDT